MPYLITDLIVNRVDLVDEGANSAAFIELFKRKEKSMEFSEILSKLKPEHATVVEAELNKVKEELTNTTEELTKAKEAIDEKDRILTETNEALEKANAELETYKEKDFCTCDGEEDEDGMCKACGKPKKGAGFDETEVLKSMPEAAKAAYIKMREQKEAAEEQVRKAAEEKAENEAIAKAATMKSLPVEQEVLVGILKNCDQSVVDVLNAAAVAIDNAVLGEVGKSNSETHNADAWGKIEAEASKIMENDKSVTKQKAISMVIKQKPELYREYLNGGGAE